MLRVTLEGAGIPLNPMTGIWEVRIAHHALYLCGRETAWHRNGLWQSDGRFYTSIAIEGRLCVELSRDDGQAISTMECDGASFHDGALWCKAAAESLIATLCDETGLWTDRTDGTTWDEVVIKPLARSERA
jgi:hypothetical protein